jgi:2-oxoisovalerate dehydrogenase E1 component beta subunit
MNAIIPTEPNAQTQTSIPRMNMIQALNSAMDVMLAQNPDVLIFGEDVGYFGGVFRATEGLQKKYGLHRCFDTPITESGLIGAAIGMGAYGIRPVVEIQFADYIYPAYDQLVSEAARLRYRSVGDFTCPITVRSPYGGGIFGGQTHSQSVEALFTHVAGLKVVIPSNPYDAKGLLISAIEDDDPVMFFEPKRLYNAPFDGRPENSVTPWAKHPLSEVPKGYYNVPLGKAKVVREGRDGASWPMALWSMWRWPPPRKAASTPRWWTLEPWSPSTSTPSPSPWKRPAAA